ncbi:DUF2177 family protein [Nitrospirillum sp. BR 11163]|uniref:DUF2177 family protein n=1 Tax=Nitrospirillum sp. BR 11163 TaxID=3104323 RepID=UPI002AFEBAE2|nr:DUF2177 family protein [Nitrospirillum sp. BR 11163]MEA1674901.1 DUF2177 family protein [Nitrospirillum sp. BR 11163]
MGPVLRQAAIYAATLIAFVALDAVWLTRMVGFYRQVMGDMVAAQPRLGPAALFYLLMAGGIAFFCVEPATRTDAPVVQALLRGALFGLLTYGTYDLTKHATLRLWSARLSALDMAWGAVLTGVAAAAGCVAALYFSRNP